MLASLLGLTGIDELAVRVRAARERLREGAGDVVGELERLLRDACAGRRRAREAAVACAIALVQDDGEGYVDDRAREAETRRLPITRVVLRQAPAHRSLLPKARLPDARGPLGLMANAPQYFLAEFEDEGDKAWELPPGAHPADEHTYAAPPKVPRPPIRRWHASRLTAREVRRYLALSPGHLDRLRADPDPERIAHVLAWRGLSLHDALVVASRRPTTVGIVRAVCADVRWMARREIREALVANPFVPTGIALKLLPTIAAPARARLVRSPHHPLLAEAVRVLASVPRAPVPTLGQPRS